LLIGEVLEHLTFGVAIGAKQCTVNLVIMMANSSWFGMVRNEHWKQEMAML
jgi:hypothetical protein